MNNPQPEYKRYASSVDNSNAPKLNLHSDENQNSESIDSFFQQCSSDLDSDMNERQTPKLEPILVGRPAAAARRAELQLQDQQQN